MAQRTRTFLAVAACVVGILAAGGCAPARAATSNTAVTHAPPPSPAAAASASPQPGRSTPAPVSSTGAASAASPAAGPPAGPATPSTATGAAVVIPSTPAGRQLSWLLAASSALPIDTSSIDAHLDAAFLAQIPPAKFNQTLAAITPPGGLRLTAITASAPWQILAVVQAGPGPLQVALSTQPDGTIGGLLVTPVVAAAPTSWTELDRRLSRVAPQVGMLSARIGPGGACTTIHAVHAATAGPLGSMFKLYILGALAQHVQAGTLRWNQQLTITSQIKSLPSGVLQNRPDGSTVTIQQAATDMISISDNTAADLLAATVGRGAVHTVQHTLGSTNTEGNTPFLRTRELFILKGADYPKYAATYLALNPAARPAYLTDTIDRVPLDGVTIWQQPRDINTLEWFASPNDLCRALAGLHTMAAQPALTPLDAIMSADDGGLKLDTTTWPAVWFKGGSEPGVLTLGWLARNTQGNTYATILMTANPNQPLDETTTVSELLALARGAFTLAAG